MFCQNKTIFCSVPDLLSLRVLIIEHLGESHEAWKEYVWVGHISP